MNDNSLNGYARLDLFGIKADGIFVNGKIQQGTVKVGGFKYQGTFDNDTLIHGDNCSVERCDIKYEGSFVHGSFVHGTMYVNGSEYKKGYFIETNNGYELAKELDIDNDEKKY